MSREFKRSVCPYDCPDTCSLIFEIEDGVIKHTKGDPDNPVTGGFVCRKMQHYEEDINSADRITTPYKRVGEKGKASSFVPITWKEAIHTIGDRWKEIIKNYGSDTIMPYSYAGTMGVIQNTCGEAFFHDLGGVSLKRTICSSAKGAGIKQVLGANFKDWSSQSLSDSDHIILWSSNPKVNRLHVVPQIQAAKKKGAKVVLIDVYQTMSADLADEVVLVNPGSDGALVLGMMYVLWKENRIDYDFIKTYTSGYEALENVFSQWSPERASAICGVAPDVIRRLALEYADAKMPRIILGSGASRYTNGGSSYVLLTQFSTLTGAMLHGGGFCSVMGSGNFVDKSLFKKPEWKDSSKRVLNMNQLGNALTDDSSIIRSLYVYNSNPAVMTPDQTKVLKGLNRDDLFLVVHDRFLTDTALLADIVLPATFSPEHDDIYTSYGHYHMQFGWKVTDAPGQCKTNLEVFSLLAKEMDLAHNYWNLTAKEMMEMVLDGASDKTSDNEFSGFFRFQPSDEQLTALREGRSILLEQGDVLSPQTSDGKIHLQPPVEICKPLKDQTYPLRFIVNHNYWTLNSNFSYRKELTDGRGKPTIWVNPADAKARGLQNDVPCRAYNQFGSMTANVKITEEVPAGRVIGSGVFQKAYTYGDGNFSSLLSEELTDLGEASTLNTQTVELEV